MKTRHIGLILLVVVLLGATFMALSVEGLRWRMRVAIHKMAGRLPEATWTELLGMMRPGSRVYLREVAETPNLNSAVTNPYDSERDVERGRATFEQECAQCHGPDGRGATGPGLREASRRHGSSDWAVFRVIRHGVPGTPMTGLALPETEVWQVVAYLRALQARPSEGTGGREKPTAAWGVAEVLPEHLFRADEDSAGWITYSGSYRSWRHSRLSQISTRNVHRLTIQWVYQTVADDLRVETTPLIVGDAMFITEPDNRVAMLDARTGAVRWAYQPPLAETLSLCCGRVNRGLAVHGRSLFLGTLDARLIALDAGTGAVRWEAELGDAAAGYSITSAPLVVGDLVVIGVSGGLFGIRGFVDAFDVTSGERRWRFYTIPGPGQPGHETWSGDSWRVGGGPVWLPGSYDRELDLLYLGVGNPAPLYAGHERTGDNLFTNSVVALRPFTGELVWHFQFVPHDVRDYDAVQIPLLVDGVVDGHMTPLLLWANRNGFYYVLDRRTGRYLRSRQFAHQTWALGLDSTGRPIPNPDAVPTREGTLIFPSYLGATNWWSPSYSPRTGLVYVPTREQGAVFFAEPGRYRTGRLYLGGRATPVFEGARTSLRALDALSGELRWEFPLGPVPDHPGMFSVGGALSTAGDVVFAGAGERFVALDAVTGEALWEFNMGGPIHAAPVTWMLDGHQRITIAAGRSIFTFALDEADRGQ